jgi:hypothetical protein
MNKEKIDENKLISLIEHTDIKTIYKTYLIPLPLIFKYILNSKYHMCVEDEFITIDDILPFQNFSKEDVKSYLKN